jgi:hypothetical protein
MAACVKALGLADATLARLAGDLPRLPMTDAVVAMRRPAIERLDRLADARAKAEAASKAEQP